MFSDYQSAVTIAEESEQAKNEEFDTMKEALTIQIKTKMEEECKNIQNKSKLKDYSPIKHYNEMTELRHQFDKINTDLETEMGAIKDILHNSLLKLINPKPVTPVRKKVKQVVKKRVIRKVMKKPDPEAQSDVEDEDEDVMNVSEIEYDGKLYYHDECSGKIYDPETSEEIGKMVISFN
jgi:hypothetical protein